MCSLLWVNYTSVKVEGKTAGAFLTSCCSCIQSSWSCLSLLPLCCLHAYTLLPSSCCCHALQVLFSFLAYFCKFLKWYTASYLPPFLTPWKVYSANTFPFRTCLFLRFFCSEFVTFISYRRNLQLLVTIYKIIQDLRIYSYLPVLLCTALF